MCRCREKHFELKSPKLLLLALVNSCKEIGFWWASEGGGASEGKVAHVLVSKLVLNSQRECLTQGNPLRGNIMQGHCISARKLARVSQQLRAFISAINLRY